MTFYLFFPFHCLEPEYNKFDLIMKLSPTKKRSSHHHSVIIYKETHTHNNYSHTFYTHMFHYNDSSKAAIKSLCMFISIWLAIASRRRRSCSLRRCLSLSAADLSTPWWLGLELSS